MKRATLLRPIVLAWCAAVATGCTSWSGPVRPAPEVLVRPRAVEARVLRADGTFLVLRDPTIRHDSIAGRLGGGPDTALALSDVARLEVRRPDGLRTAGLVLLGAALPFVAFLLLWTTVGDGGRT